MIKPFIALAFASMLAALLWYAKDYGGTESELVHTTEQLDIVEQAEQTRSALNETESAGVVQAIDNAEHRAAINRKLKKQATAHERELEENREDTVDTLSAVTVERMRQYASKNSTRQQLGPGERIPAPP